MHSECRISRSMYSRHVAFCKLPGDYVSRTLFNQLALHLCMNDLFSRRAMDAATMSGHKYAIRQIGNPGKLLLQVVHGLHCLYDGVCDFEVSSGLCLILLEGTVCSVIRICGFFVTNVIMKFLG